MLSPSFSTTLGTPIGDPLSPLLFALYIADLPKSLPEFDFPIRIILFADDVVILADSPDHLQQCIDAISNYSDANFLKINVVKSKCLVFHKGRLPKCTFFLNNVPLEQVNKIVAWADDVVAVYLPKRHAEAARRPIPRAV